LALRQKVLLNWPQTVYDLVMKEVFFGMKIYGSYICLLYMAGRFVEVRNFFLTNKTSQTIACALYFFSYTSMCLKSAILFVIRIFCVVKMSLLDETFGERKVIFVSNLICFAAGLLAAVTLSVLGEVNSGSFKALITGEVTPSGADAINKSTIAIDSS